LLAERGIAVSRRAPLGEPLRADDRRASAQAPSKTTMRPGILTKSI
jgi:hypothetical protein